MSKHKGICPTCESFCDLETITVIMRRDGRGYQSRQTRCSDCLDEQESIDVLIAAASTFPEKTTTPVKWWNQFQGRIGGECR